MKNFNPSKVFVDGTYAFLTMQLKSMYFGVGFQSKEFIFFHFIYVVFNVKMFFGACISVLPQTIFIIISPSYIIPRVPLRGCLDSRETLVYEFLVYYSHTEWYGDFLTM